MSVIASVRWIALAQATKIGTQLVSVTVLARLLEPRAYGLMAMAALAMNLAYLFKDLGTGVAIINLPALREEVTSLMGRLVRHRHADADLLHAAYAWDIGGSD